MQMFVSNMYLIITFPCLLRRLLSGVHKIAGEMFQTIYKRTPPAIFRKKNDYLFKFLDIHVCPRKSAVFWKANSLTSSVGKNFGCFHRVAFHNKKIYIVIYTIIFCLCQDGFYFQRLTCQQSFQFPFGAMVPGIGAKKAYNDVRYQASKQWCQASEQWWSNGARHRSNGARHRSNGGAMVPGSILYGYR